MVVRFSDDAFGNGHRSVTGFPLGALARSNIRAVKERKVGVCILRCTHLMRIGG